MKIKKASISDFEHIFSLWHKAGLSNAGKKREHREYNLLIKHNPNSCLVAIERGAIIGTVFGAFNGRRAWIYHLVVAPEYQGKGLGRNLMKEVEKKLKLCGATKIIVGVGIRNLGTVPFYEKCGFKVMHDAVLFEKGLDKVN